MNLEPDGAEHHARALCADDIAGLSSAIDRVLGQRPRARLGGGGRFDRWLAVANALAAARLGPGARPVRAMVFDKSPSRNWSLGWHQDRTIAVTKPGAVPGYEAWTLKHGFHHVVPPIALLQRMLTMRIHLDPVEDGNAPLLIAPGSHRRGHIAEPDIADGVAARGTRTCLADAGDIWLYATLILHASERSRADRRRRVLQIFYSADDLPAPLAWLGV